MNSLDVLRILVSELRLEAYTFSLVEHFVGVNWRVRYSSFKERYDHLDESLVQHQPHKISKISGKELLLCNFSPEGYLSNSQNVISISSRVSSKRWHRHIPIMNLHPENGLERYEIKTIVQAATNNMHGYLLESGRHYHFYGIELLTQQNWLRLMSQFLMPTIIVSPRYIGHSLYRGYATLRLTTHSSYKPTIPTVCDSW